MIKINDLSVVLKNQPLLQKISCSLRPGSISCFIGPSGAGKTTLLKTICGLIPSQSGSVEFEESDSYSSNNRLRGEKIGYLFQNFNLFPHLTALENCIDPLIIRGITREEAQQQAFKLLEKMNMAPYAHKYPGELSGGQQQRVAIARMLVLQPSIILLDEPTASLDAHNKDILTDILRLLANQNITVVISTHDPSFAQKVGDDMYYIKAGEIVECCTKQNGYNECPLIQEFFMI